MRFRHPQLKTSLRKFPLYDLKMDGSNDKWILYFTDGREIANNELYDIDSFVLMIFRSLFIQISKETSNPSKNRISSVKWFTLDINLLLASWIATWFVNICESLLFSTICLNKKSVNQGSIWKTDKFDCIM